MMQAAGVGAALCTTRATVCRFPGSVIASCTRVFRVNVSQTAGAALQAAITQQATFGAANRFLFWPGIAANVNEAVAVPFHFVSPYETENNLSTWWTLKSFGERSFTSRRPLTTGTCQQVVTRTGDYAGAETDPTDLRSFWLAGERALEILEFGNACLWETWISRVTPGGTKGPGGPKVAASGGAPD